jgi:prepilin-type N-terminal cleavage/methylation domain-containing protein
MMARGASGFTVLEMLVALSILGLLSVYAMQSFQSMRRMDIVLDRIEQRSTLGTVELHLRNLVGAARLALKSAGGRTTIAFDGAESQLQLVVASDGVLEQGGLLTVHIGAKPRSDGFFVLTTRRATYSSSEVQTSDDELVLLERVTSFGLRYFGQGDGEQSASWHSQWRDQTALPRLIEVTIQMAAKERLAQQKWILRPAAAGL